MDIQWLICHPRSEESSAAVRWLKNYVSGSGVTISGVRTSSDMLIGARRNKALSRARGKYTVNIDDDYFLLGDHSLLNRINAIESDDDVAWAAGHIQDCLPDESMRDWTNQVPAGVYPLGESFLKEINPEADLVRLHTSTVLAPTEVLRAVGGWHPELLQAEDLFMLFNLSVYSGEYGHKAVIVDGQQPVLAYRKHHFQMTAGEGYKDRDAYIIPGLASSVLASIL